MTNIEQMTQAQANTWERIGAQQEQREQTRQDNFNRYQVNISDEKYKILNNAITQFDDPEQMQAEAYKMANAIKYSEMYDIDPAEAYQNLDMLNEGTFGTEKYNSPKDWFIATTDSWQLGINQVKKNNLGFKVMDAIDSGDTESLSILEEKIKALEAEDATMVDHQPRSWVVDALKFGAQSLPFTGATAGASLIGGLLAGPVGAAGAGFGAAYLGTRGAEYLELRNDGASHEVAKGVSLVSSSLQAVVETALGNVAGLAGGALSKAGVKIIGEGAREAVTDAITKNVFKRLHFGGVFKTVSKTLTAYGQEAIEEGLEEVLQELVSSAGRAVASELGEYNLDDNTAKDIGARAAESFRGGFLGSLVLGVGSVALNAKATAKDAINLKESAETINSQEVFNEATKNNAMFEGMSDEARKEVQTQIWETNKTKREQKETELAKDESSIIAADDNIEETQLDDEGNLVEKDTPFRTSEGRLYTGVYDTETDTDGVTTGQFRVGDGNKKKQNLYGYIDYKEDENTVTIKDFALASGRSGITQEVFQEFAEQFSGKEIVWDAETNAQNRIKKILVNSNPRGSGYGLSYYKDGEVNAVKSRVEVAKQLKQYMPNLSDNERSVAITLLEARASAMNQSFNDYVQSTYTNEIFTTEGEILAAAQAQGKNIKGGVTWKTLGEETKAVIYASENGDFSTWVHENAHVFRRQLSGALKESAESAFSVENGIWTTQQEEAFATGFEDYLREGKAPTPDLKNLFQKLAEFLTRIYKELKSRVKLTPEITAVYDQLLADSEGALSNAERAVAISNKTKLNTDENIDTEEKISSIIQKDTGYQTLQSDKTENETYNDVEELTNDPMISTTEKVEAVYEEAAKTLPEDREIPEFLFQDNDINYVELTGIKSKNVTEADLIKYIDELANQVFKTSSEGLSIKIPSKPDDRRHVVKASMKGQFRNKKVRLTKALLDIKNIIENATYTSSKQNTKPTDKPDVLRYYYFTVNVKIGENIWKIQLDCEEKKSAVAGRPHKDAIKGQYNNTQNDNDTAGMLHNKAPHLHDVIGNEDTISINNMQVGKVLSLYQIKQIDVLFQENTRPELDKDILKDATSFGTWQEFYEYYENEDPFLKFLIPENADSRWYQTTWELANNIYPDESMVKEILTDSDEKDARRKGAPDTMDALWMSEMDNPGKLEAFLQRIAEIENAKEWQPGDAQEQQEVEKLLEMKSLIHSQLRHGSWIGQAAKVYNGKTITDTKRKELLTLIRGAVRDYRDIYAELMNQEQWKVADEDKTGEQIRQKLAELNRPSEDTTKMTPNQRAKFAESLDDEQLSYDIKTGKYKLDEKLDNHIRNLNAQIRESEKKTNAIQKEMETDYRRISDWETREILRVKEKLDLTKAKLENRKIRVSKRITQGLEISQKYEYDTHQLQADYDTLFRKFVDLKNILEASGEAKSLLTRLETLTQEKTRQRELKSKARQLNQVRKMRTGLVKRIMRRVPFERIDYNNAKTIIAIQSYINDWVRDGVNKWIGTEGPYLREVYSRFKTDSEYRELLSRQLSKGKKKRKALKLLAEAIGADGVEHYVVGKKFDEFTREDRKLIYEALPKEDWIKELRLDELSEERDGSIQLKDKDGKLNDEAMELVNDALPGDIKALLQRPIKEWELNDVERLAGVIDNLYTQGRKMLETKRELRKFDNDAIRERIEKQIRDTGIYINDDDPEDVKKKKQEKINKILGVSNAVKGTLAASEEKHTLYNRMRDAGYAAANVRRIARILDNNTDGINTTMLYWRENECFNEEQKNLVRRQNKVESKMKELGISIDELFKKIEVKNFFDDGSSATFTVDELLFMLAAIKDENSGNAVIYGNMLDETEKSKFREQDKAEKESGTVTKGEMSEAETAFCNKAQLRFSKVLDIAQGLDEKMLKLLHTIQDDYKAQYDRLNKASIEEFNMPVWRVDNYVPIIRREANGEVNEKRVAEDLIGEGVSTTQQWVGKGMTQKRIQIAPVNQMPIELGLYSTWADSLKRNEHFIAYSGYVRDLNRIYKSRDAKGTKAWIERRYGKGMTKYIDSYINEVANPNAVGQKTELDKVVRMLRGKTAPAYLAWKMSGILKQAVSSPWPCLQYVNPIEYASAAFDLMKKGTAESIKAKSAYMNSRKFDPIVDLVNEAKEKATNKVSYGISQFNALGMKGLEMIDWVAVAPGWLATYRKNISELTKLNETLKDDKILSPEEIEQKAIDKADDMVRMCQPSARSVDLAPLFKSTGPHSELVKAVLQFQTSLNVIWQNIRYDLPYAVKYAQWGQALSIVGYYAAAGISLGLLTDGLTGNDDDDKELKNLQKFIYYSTTQFSDSIPVIGSAISDVNKRLITGEKGFYGTSSLFPTLDKMTNAVKSASSQNWVKAAQSFGEGVGMYLGLPVSGAKELMEVAGVGDSEESFKPEAFLGRR